MCKTPHSPLSGLSGHTHTSSRAKENLAEPRAGWLASRDGPRLSPAWPGGEQFSIKCRQAASGMPAQRLPCTFAAQRVILLGNLSTEDKEELGEQNELWLQRVIFISKRISATLSPVAANDIPSVGEIPWMFCLGSDLVSKEREPRTPAASRLSKLLHNTILGLTNQKHLGIIKAI